ncbi:VWA domain-containing protein [Leucothrix mucor]|uniref:VWA domain-containing protein n=1 Tax=Leucothrix mucor TaxID=45248 RepID=UPI0003B4F1C3|nr:VWA domain-containing protein [Leucothrix mucor]
MKSSRFHLTSAAAALGVLIAVSSQMAIGDDTEIFFSESISTVNPNVMFVIDVSGSMDEEVSGSGGLSRLEVMQSALRTVLKTAPENLNVGLMNYGEVAHRNEGHGIKFPAKDITGEALPIVGEKFPADEWGNQPWWQSSIPEPAATLTVRDYLSQITDWYWKDGWYSVAYGGSTAVELEHVGNTPIVEALYEAALYFRGEKVTYGLGDSGNWNRWSAHPSTYEGDPITWNGDICKSTYTASQSTPIDFANNEYPWYRCPADPNNLGPDGTYANCKSLENCTTTTTEVCVESVPSVCSEWSTDEGGKSYCSGTWSGGGCKDGITKSVTETSCSYEICGGGNSTEPNYVSPITESCQSNFIVLLSDGKPQYSYSYDSAGNRDGTNSPGPTYWGFKDGRFTPMVDQADSSNTFGSDNCDANPTPSGFRSGACGPELTSFLANSDHNSDLVGPQTIDTYAIGFGLDGEPAAQEYLKSLVSTDDPSTEAVEGYFSAEDEVQLSQAFSSILAKIGSTTTSFASPSYSVNTKTGIQNEEFVYIPVFDKALTPRWNGNLKKFKLVSDGTKTSIVGKNNKAAVSDLGVFEEDAKDLWSATSEADGRDVTAGGVANLINPNTRKAVSDLKCTTYPCALMVADNRINPANAFDTGGLITNDVMGLPDTTTVETRQAMVNFILGRKLNTETGEYELFPHMGDMLHFEPLVMTYDKNYRENASEAIEYNKQVIYAATNEGYLHAFDTTSGKELFAFMPSSLMRNIQTQYYNTDTGSHSYGVDGILTSWFDDKNKDGVVDSASGDRVYLYFGLRRGGREYYALDVTNPKEPKVLWKVSANVVSAIENDKKCKEHPGLHLGELISNGLHLGKYKDAACDPNIHAGEGDFANLGQSWSTPYLTKIRTSGSTFKEVVIFSGGYDINQDIQDLDDRAAADSMGNDVFIVDALTGQRIWSLQSSALGGAASNGTSSVSHSIPGGLRILDMNQDGAVDRVYFTDTAAQVWRLEFPVGPSYDLKGARLIKLADLGGSGSNSRMFFNEPDVALLKHKGKPWLAISVGSGYRAHPADETVADAFYVLLDAAVNTPLESSAFGDGAFATLTESDLVQVSATAGQSASAINQGDLTGQTIFDVENKAGWFLKLPNVGEKVLSTSITAQGKVMFTTLVPNAGASEAVVDLCTSPLTQGRFYSLDLLTATAGDDLNNDGVVGDADLFTVISANEIPGSPQQIFNEPFCSDESRRCTQSIDVRVGKANNPAVSYDASFLENVFWKNPPKN